MGQPGFGNCCNFSFQRFSSLTKEESNLGKENSIVTGSFTTDLFLALNVDVKALVHLGNDPDSPLPISPNP